MTALTGLVLAGGASRRMGVDKATLVLDGERLVDRAIRRLGDACGRVLVASGDGARLDVAAEQVADHDAGGGAGEGPLAGILAGLRAAETPLVAVVAVDLPWSSPQVLRRLAELWTGQPAVAARVEGRLEPLHAVWSVAATERIAGLYAAGERSPTRALERLGARVAEPAAWRDLDDGRFARGVNDPEEAAAAGLEVRDAPPPHR